MKPHPRIRKTIKWGGAVVSVLLLVAWVGSASNFTYHDYGRTIEGSAYDGWVLFVHRENPIEMRTQTTFLQLPTPFGMSEKYFLVYDRRAHGFAVPLWLPVSVMLLVTAAVWRLDSLARRRARLNLCSKCNYDRAGLALGAVCPECGAAASSSPST